MLFRNTWSLLLSIVWLALLFGLISYCSGQ